MMLDNAGKVKHLRHKPEPVDDKDNPADWWLLSEFCKNHAQYKYSTIKQKIYNSRSGLIEGYHWGRSGDGRLTLNIPRYMKWLIGGK